MVPRCQTQGPKVRSGPAPSFNMAHLSRPHTSAARDRGDLIRAFEELLGVVGLTRPTRALGSTEANILPLVKGAWSGGRNTPTLLFVISNFAFCASLERFAAKCEAVGMKISFQSSNAEVAMCKWMKVI